MTDSKNGSPIGSNSPKIDDETVTGLLGTNNSLAYKVHEIEKHLHNVERWMGLAASPSGETHRADSDSMTPFRIDAGNDTWGAWVQICGSDDTPVTAGMVKLDVHRIVISDVENTKTLTKIQLAGGASGAAALAAGDYTEIMLMPEKDGKQDPIDVMMPRFIAGTKGWARCWVSGENTSWIDFFYGLHEYKG